MSRILEHYVKEEVVREIVDFSVNKWVAIHCSTTTDNQEKIMLRYFPRSRRPLRIDSEDDFRRLFNLVGVYRPRTFYASINVYARIDSLEYALDRMNIIGSTPTWDIDSTDNDYRKVVAAAREILDILEKLHISRSLIIKWSGRGMHIHVHPNAFSPELYSRIHPVDVAYSVTEYVLRRITPVEGVNIENKIDMGRVFTTPLSLHRELDRVAVCINVDELEDFDLSWTDIGNFKHDKSWRRHITGEGDDLAEKAFVEIGPYIYKGGRRRIHKPLDKQIMETFNRFKNVF
ncbi:MAG: hypothetical protein QXF28_05970 [Nitrososphaerota archaeon]